MGISDKDTSQSPLRGETALGLGSRGVRALHIPHQGTCLQPGRESWRFCWINLVSLGGGGGRETKVPLIAEALERMPQGCPDIEQEIQVAASFHTDR